MVITVSDFIGDIVLNDPDVVPGYQSIINQVEDKYLRMLLGNEQYQQLYDEYLVDGADTTTDNYDKWDKFINGERYSYNNTFITFEGAKNFLKYFCWVELINKTDFTSGNDIYRQEVTSGKRVEGIERKELINDNYNKGVFHYRRAYYYMYNNSQKFDITYFVNLNYKRGFSGITL